MFPVINVPSDASELPEQVGSKYKFWFNKGSQMFKMSRDGTGEGWSEKIASEVCHVLCLPHAEYDLATWQGRPGIVTKNFVQEHCRLVLGNELLSTFDKQYLGTQRFRQRQHTIGRILAALKVGDIHSPITVPPGLESFSPSDFFVGYLLLDAWIGNTDRHHENWGLIVAADGKIHLAPSFDHASSLGRELTDYDRTRRLSTRDEQQTISAYAARAMSALYRTETDKRPLPCIDAFREIAKHAPHGAAHWIAKLKEVREDQIGDIIARVPLEVMTNPAREFTMRLLRENRKRLIN